MRLLRVITMLVLVSAAVVRVQGQEPPAKLDRTPTESDGTAAAAQKPPNPVDKERPLPGGWQLNARPSSRHYRIGLDRQVFHGGKSAGLLESQEAQFQQNHYASMVQSLDVRSHRGKRLRLSAFLKTEDVRESVYLNVNIPHLYADSEDRFRLKPLIQGNTDWKRYEVEFTVTDMEGTAEIQCSVDLHGPGRVWIDDVSLEQVGDLENVRTTPAANNEKPPSPFVLFDELANTGFEQTLLEYDLSLLQGQWEITYPTKGKTKFFQIIREVLEVDGNKITFTYYSQNQDGSDGVGHQLTNDFDLERSGRISLITRRNTEVTNGPSKGSFAPAGSASSNPYTVNRSQFVEVFNLLDGANGPPILRPWNRVAKSKHRVP